MTILLLVLLSLPNQAQASTPCPKELEDRVFLCTPSKAEQDEILDHARKGTKAQAKIEGAAKEEAYREQRRRDREENGGNRQPPSGGGCASPDPNTGIIGCPAN